MAETAETSIFDEFKGKDCVFVADWLKTKGLHKLSGRKIAPNTGANATKFFILAMLRYRLTDRKIN